MQANGYRLWVISQWINERFWANRRGYSLSSWWGSNPDRSADIDARTGATQTAYKRYSIDWDWRDRNGNLIEDGNYLLHFECTNSDSGNPRNYTTLALTKGRVPWVMGPVTQGGYEDIVLTYTLGELTVSTLVSTEINERSAVLSGSISGADTDQTLHTWIYWGDEDGADQPGDWDYRVDLGQQGNGTFTSQIDALEKAKTYYYRAAAQNEASLLWAEQSVSFVAQATVTLFTEGDFWRYFEGRTFPGSDWASLAYDDQDWPEGPAGFGYADGDDQTELDMRNQYVTLYLRRHFQIEEPNQVAQLTFTVDYDDGFVAFINGLEVARRGVDTGQDHTTTADNHSASVDGGAVETIDLATADLQAGDNVFAIEVHNQDIGSSDLTLIPTLTVTGGISSPQPVMVLDVNALDFGNVPVGQSQTLSVIVSNEGELPLEIEAINLVGLHAKDFSWSTEVDLPVTVDVGLELAIEVEYQPAAAQSSLYTELVIASDDWDAPVQVVSLQGQGQ